MPFDIPTYLVVGFLLVATAVALFFLFRIHGASLGRRLLFAGGLLGSLLLVVPGVLTLSTSLVKADLTSYREFWSGLEEKAWVEEIACEKDGSCRRTYSCDPYQVEEIRYRTTYDSEGNMKQEPYVEMVTRYRSCPHVTTEYSYYVSDSLGKTYTFGKNLFPASPADYRWRGEGWQERDLPAVESGPPAAWVAVEERLAARNPGGTTSLETYTNYVLPVQQAAAREGKRDLKPLLEAGLLPRVATQVVGPYDAEKVYFAGVEVAHPGEWQFHLQRFNGLLGSQRQGDLHVVLVDASQGVDPQAYGEALQAWWQDPALGKHTLSKNGIALILGVEGRQVKWSSAFTGMPTGNEEVVAGLSSLDNLPLDPAHIFHREGPLAALLLQEPGFKRVEMKDYEYLAEQVRPSLAALIPMGLVAFVLGGLLLLGATMAGVKLEEDKHPLFKV